MATAGVRELRQRASELLRRVENGETIEITDRGRAVALLTPLPDGGPLERLRAAGETIPPTADTATLLAPLVLPPDSELPSEILARMQADER